MSAEDTIVERYRREQNRAAKLGVKNNELIQRIAELERQIERMKPVVEAASYLRPEVLAFARAMEMNLRANDHKGHWRECSDEYLLLRAYEELAELQTCRSGDTLSEAADVANFCMMAADNAGELVQEE